MQIPKNYNKEEEKAVQEFWDKERIYAFNPEDDKELYVIDTPPPTVSGEMHLGHAFSYAQQDFIVRFHRMQGKNILYPFGTDDNGLATERLIERIKNVKSVEMDRQEFINLCLSTLEEIRPKYVADWKKLGISCDFSIFYSTIDKHCRKIAQWSFIDLYKKGRVYRKEAPTIFCPECRTAIAQVEMKDKELESTFNDIVFKVDDEEIIIATTRPELLPACVAVFFHPDDERYKHLEGKEALVPLFNFKVPIFPDERVDPTKGTGIVMCCTFGDQTDVEWFKAFNLPLKEAIGKDGRLTDIAGKYKGMTIKEARKAIIEDLKKAGLLKASRKIKHVVNVHERCETEIEILHSKQWFIKYLDLKEVFLKLGKQLRWFPEHMRYRYDNWIKGLQWDWCISRQRYFGIPFPVWYCKNCNEVILADENSLPVDPLHDKAPLEECPKCKSKEFIPEKDVFDTWHTSSLTPYIVAMLFKDKPIFDKLLPMNLRPQAHDIISFWLFNTVVKHHLHFNQLPWYDVAISGFVLDPYGKKMSKSKGNVIRPQYMMEKYSADALRFWAASSRLGEDLPFKEKELIAGQRLIQKLWNASRFALMHLKDYNGEEPEHLHLFDRWILTKLMKIVKKATNAFLEYDYSVTKREVENFFWHSFCNNYLEIIKDRVYNPDKRGEDARISALFTLYNALLIQLKLLAPIMPHITEKIYQIYFKEREKVKSIHISKWPEYNPRFIDEDAERIGDILVEIITKVRAFKTKNKLSLKESIKELRIKCKDEDLIFFKEALDDLKAVTKAREILFTDANEKLENFDVYIDIIN